MKDQAKTKSEHKHKTKTNINPTVKSKAKPVASTAHQANRKVLRRRLICLLAYLIVPIFFAILYLTMTMNYEDLYQRAANLDDSIGTVLYRTYHWLPRTGELYQRMAIHFMTPQLSLGLDLVFRLCTAAIASGLVFLLATFALGRRPRLTLSDALVNLGFFICLLLFGSGEIFTFNFSYAHNYVISALLLVAFALPYRLRSANHHPVALVGMLTIGTLLGMSSEIIPIVLLLILAGFAIYKLALNHSLQIFWRTYRLQIVGVLGLVCGLVLYYAGASLTARINGGYGDLYDYVSPFGVFTEPVYTIGKMVRHLFYNIRYFHFAIILMLLILLLEYVNYRRQQPHHLSIQIACLAFCTLYVGATSLLAVHEDLYYRFMAPVYITVYGSVWLYASSYLTPKMLTQHMLCGIYLVLVAVGVVMIGDLGYAMTRYNLVAKPYLQEIVVDEESFPMFDSALTSGEHDMPASPIFQIRQSSPFHW